MDEYKIVVDTREQTPLFKGEDVVVKKLDTGDYSIEGLENRIAIERKTLTDLFGTLGRGHKRFRKELERARELDYFAIIIEGNYNKIKHKGFPGSYHIKMKGSVVSQIILTLHVKYGINVFMCNDRNEVKSIIKDIFKTYYKHLNTSLY